MEKVQLKLAYLFGFLGFIVIFSLNYFHKEIGDVLVSVPDFIIPFLSLVILLVLVYIMWHRELDIDNMKYQFLTIATHKFRTPLTGIKWMVDVLKKEMPIEEKLKLLKQMEVAVDRLMEVVDVMTGLARFDKNLQYAFEVAWLREMVDVSLDKYAARLKEKNIKLDIATDHEIPLAIIDKRKIQFVVDMLLENAIQYSPIGGHIEMRLFRDKNFVVLSVKDEGVGIKSKEIPHIFERFYRSEEAKTADPEGMGLSLAMIKEILEKHGGKVWAESEGVGKGSTFFMKVRISDQKPS